MSVRATRLRRTTEFLSKPVDSKDALDRGGGYAVDRKSPMRFCSGTRVLPRPCHGPHSNRPARSPDRPIPSRVLRFNPDLVSWTAPVEGFLRALQASGVSVDLRPDANADLTTFRTVLGLPWVQENVVSFVNDVLLAEDSGLSFRIPPAQFSEGAQEILALLASSHEPGASEALAKALSLFGGFLPSWRDARIGSDGRARLRTAQVSLPTGARDERCASVEIYGYPTRIDGRDIVFYRVHLDADRNLVDDRGKALRSMPLDRFFGLVGDDYVRQLHAGKLVLAPTEDAGCLRAFRVESAPTDKLGQVALVSPGGVRRTCDVRELFQANLGASVSMLEAFDALHRAGGSGRALLIADHEDPATCGHYLLIDEAPRPPSGRLPRSMEHPEARDKIVDLMERGLPVLMIGQHDRPGFVATTFAANDRLAASMGSLEPTFAGKPAVVFKPCGGLQSQDVYFALAHEGVHVVQQLEGQIESQRRLLDRLRDAGLLSSGEACALDRFMGEQPAYAKQLELMATEISILGEGLAASALAGDRKALVAQFINDIAAPASAAIEKLASQPEHTHYAELLTFLRARCSPSPEVGLAVLDAAALGP